MKLGMVTQWYDPETGPASLPATYAREMVAQGHSVRVLTGFPNYPEGKLYPGYKQRHRWTEIRDGVSLVRVPLYTDHSSSAAGRVTNYASFAASASVLGSNALRGADAIWVYNSPVTVTAPVMLQSRFGKVPYFLHVMDLWPDSLIQSGMLSGGRLSSFAEVAVRNVVRLAERRAHVVGVISPSVRNLVLERDPGLDPSKVVFVPNPADESLFLPVEQIRREFNVAPYPHHFTVMYAGAIGEVQGLDAVLDAAALLRDVPRVRFQFFGDGIARARLQQRAVEESLTNVDFMGRIPQTDVPLQMACADAQLVSLGVSDFLRYTMPSKIASLLCSGVPIIAQISGDGADLLQRSGAARTAAPGDAQRIAEAVMSLAQEDEHQLRAVGSAGRKFYKDKLSIKKNTRKIIDTLRT